MREGGCGSQEGGGGTRASSCALFAGGSGIRRGQQRRKCGRQAEVACLRVIGIWSHMLGRWLGLPQRSYRAATQLAMPPPPPPPPPPPQQQQGGGNCTQHVHTYGIPAIQGDTHLRKHNLKAVLHILCPCCAPPRHIPAAFAQHTSAYHREPGLAPSTRCVRALLPSSMRASNDPRAQAVPTAAPSGAFAIHAKRTEPRYRSCTSPDFMRTCSSKCNCR